MLLDALAVLSCLLFADVAFACEKRPGEAQEVLIFPPKYKALHPSEDYAFKVVQLALAESEEKYGPCVARLLERELPVKRMELYLENDQNIHVVSLTVSHKRDKRFLPVRIPIAKGLIGFRMLLIREGEQARFTAVQGKSDLVAFTAGQGQDWVDTHILRKNGLPVVTTENIPSLFEMLLHKRFDYFPRGALQVTAEEQIFGDQPIVVEPTLALSYPSMTAIYVNKRNKKLAERLEYGLKRAYASGSFNRLFYSHPAIVEALAQLDLKKRTIIQICNPYLPEWVPMDVDQYWLQPWPPHLQASDCVAGH